uniref:J domain-containing protein n=1 Tax=Chenopodium quinoa TaxID=63459 RepID=A0A803LFZ3_CHEQI
MDPHTQRAEAERWLGIAAKLLTARDFLGSKTFAIRAREADPNNAVSDQILAVVDTVLAGEKRVNSNQQPDWYAVLQLPRLVRDPELIADHYRRLVLCLNPERNRFPFADYALQMVMDAWSVLSDPTKKWLFDNELALGYEWDWNWGESNNNCISDDTDANYSSTSSTIPATITATSTRIRGTSIAATAVCIGGFSITAWKKQNQGGNLNGASNWMPFSPMFTCPVENGGKGFQWFDNNDGNANVGPKNVVTKNTPRVYIDDDDILELSEPSDLDSSDASGGGVSVGGDHLEDGSEGQVVIGLTADRSDTGKTVTASVTRKQTRRSKKDVGRLDLNVEFNNDGEEHAPTVASLDVCRAARISLKLFPGCHYLREQVILQSSFELDHSSGCFTCLLETGVYWLAMTVVIALKFHSCLCMASNEYSTGAKTESSTGVGRNEGKEGSGSVTW